MGFMSAERRSRILNLPRDDEEWAKQAIQIYATRIVGSDERRLVWLLESAANSLANEIDALEAEISNLSYWKRDTVPKVLTLKRLCEDFEFLWALLSLARNKMIENSAKGLAEFFAQRKKK